MKKNNCCKCKINCRKCGEQFESEGASALCPNCKRRNHTKAYLWMAIIISYLGFVVGIILGNALKITIGEFSAYREEIFNYGAMIYCWCATLVFDFFIFAVYSICYRLDLLIDKKEN